MCTIVSLRWAAADGATVTQWHPDLILYPLLQFVLPCQSTRYSYAEIKWTDEGRQAGRRAGSCTTIYNDRGSAAAVAEDEIEGAGRATSWLDTPKINVIGPD